MSAVRIIHDFQINYWSGIALYNKWLGFGLKKYPLAINFDFGFLEYYYFPDVKTFYNMTRTK